MITLADVQRYWDAYADEIRCGDSEWGSRRFFQHIKESHDRAFAYSNVLLDIPARRGQSILEIGCGIGIDALELAKNGAEVTYLGPSPKSIELTRRYFAYQDLEATIEVGNPESLRFGPGTFDAVIARGILMFVPDAERVVAEINRVLKPGGEVLAHLHNRYSWYVFLAKLSGAKLMHEAQDPPISTLHSTADANRMFAGFSSVNVFLDRFPSRTASRSGVFARLYNDVVVPLSTIIPRAIIRPFGFYIIIQAVK